MVNETKLLRDIYLYFDDHIKFRIKEYIKPIIFNPIYVQMRELSNHKEKLKLKIRELSFTIEDAVENCFDPSELKGLNDEINQLVELRSEHAYLVNKISRLNIKLHSCYF